MGTLEKGRKGLGGKSHDIMSWMSIETLDHGKNNKEKQQNLHQWRNELPIAHLPHMKCIKLGCVRSSHLPFNMHYVRSSLHVFALTGE